MLNEEEMELAKQHLSILQKYVRDLDAIAPTHRLRFSFLMTSAFSLMRAGLSLCHDLEHLKYQLEGVYEKLAELKENLINEINQKEKPC